MEQILLRCPFYRNVNQTPVEFSSFFLFFAYLQISSALFGIVWGYFLSLHSLTSSFNKWSSNIGWQRNWPQEKVRWVFKMQIIQYQRGADWRPRKRLKGGPCRTKPPGHPRRPGRALRGAWEPPRGHAQPGITISVFARWLRRQWMNDRNKTSKGKPSHARGCCRNLASRTWLLLERSRGWRRGVEWTLVQGQLLKCSKV